MPPVFQSEGLTRSVGDGRILFGDLKLSIHEGDKIGLVAKNGTGKTSLLRIIASVDAPDSGSMTFRNGVRVGYLAQTPDVPRGMSALDACVAMVGSRDVHDDEASLRLECEKMLGKLGLTDIQADTGSLSGGQRKRLAMAALLVSQPDFLIRDEPTNHLDIPAIEWLEKYLQRTNATLLMVTHDRYFLDRICRRIWELDNEQIFDYEGDYAYYLRRRQERIEALGAELDKVRNTLRREQEWMSRQPQARAGKAKYRIDAFYDLKERSQVNLREKNVDLSNMKSSRIGSKIIEAQAVSKRYGDKVILDDFTYTFARGEKIGIVGGNGVGKTTLMRILQGLEPMDKGNIEVGTTIRFGYYTQERNLELDGSKRVVDAVTELSEDIVLPGGVRLSPMQFLTRFLFSPADQRKYISTLSGGELSRLALAVVLMQSPNFLILDEPTNDLDIVTLGLLADYLKDFEGCVLVVTHDRHFLDSIADHLFVLEGDGVIKDFPGTYSEYSLWRAENSKPSAEEKQRTDTRKPREQRKRMTYAETREFEALTVEIEALNKEKRQLEQAFADGDTPENIAKMSERYSALKEILEEKEWRWLTLSERAE